MLGAADIIIIVFVIVVAIIVGIYYLNRWASRKSVEQQSLIDQNKQSVSIYVIDKKRDLAKNVNLPKTVASNLPKIYKRMKMYFVQAKIGPQIMTLMCDKKIYNQINLKKNMKVEIAGIYIIAIKTTKTEKELLSIKNKQKQAQQIKADMTAKKSIISSVKRWFSKAKD